jgi:hypothetical protein
MASSSNRSTIAVLRTEPESNNVNDGSVNKQWKISLFSARPAATDNYLNVERDILETH